VLLAQCGSCSKCGHARGLRWPTCTRFPLVTPVTNITNVTTNSVTQLTRVVGPVGQLLEVWPCAGAGLAQMHRFHIKKTPVTKHTRCNN
jgi:hypothetical protein